MAQSGYLCHLPEDVGGYRILMRYLTPAQMSSIRKRFSDETDIVDGYCEASIAAVDPDLAATIECKGQANALGLVEVNDLPPGRREAFIAIGERARQFIQAAWAKKNRVSQEEIGPFLATIEDVAL